MVVVDGVMWEWVTPVLVPEGLPEHPKNFDPYYDRHISVECLQQTGAC